MIPQPSESRCAAAQAALIALALGAPQTPDLNAHLDTCPHCRRRLRSLRHMRAGLLCGPIVAPGAPLRGRIARLIVAGMRAAQGWRVARHLSSRP